MHSKTSEMANYAPLVSAQSPLHSPTQMPRAAGPSSPPCRASPAAHRPLPPFRFHSLLVLVAAAFYLPRTTFGQAQSDSPQDVLWREIQSLVQPAATTQPAESFDAAISRRQLLHAAIERYANAYPGGTHRVEALRLDLQALFELGSLRNGQYAALRDRVTWLLLHNPDAATRHEAAYWAIIAESAFDERAPAGDAPTSTPAAASGTAPTQSAAQRQEAFFRAYRRYFADYPSSRYAPRIADLLFERAARDGDQAEMGRIVETLAAHSPTNTVTTRLTAVLRRHSAVGQSFWLEQANADGTRIDTRSATGRLTLIVVWAGAAPAVRSCVRSIAELRQTNADIAVFGVNLDATAEEMTAACRDLGMDWPQAHDGFGPANSFARQWGVSSVPFVFVVDRNGLLAAASDSDRWRRIAERLLADSTGK